MNRIRLFFVKAIFAYCLVFIFQVNCTSAQAVKSHSKLVIGLAGTEPFVFKNDSNPKGIAVEIWNQIAAEKGWLFRFKYFNTVDSALQALDDTALGVVVGPVSITSNRLVTSRFSQPYYNSSLAIASLAKEPTLWEKVKPFFSLKLLTAVLVFLVILSTVGTLFWLAERKRNPEQFPEKPAEGIANGMWLAIVTMSTVGYGDKAPVTLRGRIIAGAWIVISIIFATSMVAGIASTLTLSSLSNKTITNIEQLNGRKAATVVNSTAEEFLQEHNVGVVSVVSMVDAIEKLHKKEVDAVVFDRPQLLYYLKTHHDKSLYISNAEYYKQGYGFAFPLNSKLVSPVNRSLLELAENQQIERVVDYYLGQNK